MDSKELREMSIANAKMALEQSKMAFEQARATINGNARYVSWPKIQTYRLTEEQKEGGRRMIKYFGNASNFRRKFEVHIGTYPDGRPQLVNLDGLTIVRHLTDVLIGEMYGEDGRDILNGMRECYSNDRFQRGFPIGS